MIQSLFRRVLGTILVLFLTCGMAFAKTDYDQPVTQLDFATGVYGAIMGMSRATLDPSDCLQMLKDRGVVPPNWNGTPNVTMGEASEIFSQLGIQIHVKDPTLLISRGDFESILRKERGNFQLVKEHWRVLHGFSTELTLGQYRERVISGSHF